MGTNSCRAPGRNAFLLSNLRQERAGLRAIRAMNGKKSTHVVSAFVLVKGHLGYAHTEGSCLHKNGDFAAISVTEQGCATPMLKVERHISG